MKKFNLFFYDWFYTQCSFISITFIIVLVFFLGCFIKLGGFLLMTYQIFTINFKISLSLRTFQDLLYNVSFFALYLVRVRRFCIDSFFNGLSNNY